MRFLSLFAGIGGFDLGLERAGMECVGQVENDPYCIKVLEKHWPNVPRWGDIRDVTEETLADACWNGFSRAEQARNDCKKSSGRDGLRAGIKGCGSRKTTSGPTTTTHPTIDLICGGFPCQPWSGAGKRGGAEDDRDLWPEMLRVIEAVRPRWVIGENVRNFVSMEMGLDRSISDLEAIGGYAVQAFIVPACAVDAPHRRDRCWVVARYTKSNGSGEERSVWQGENTKPRRVCEDVADGESARRETRGGDGVGIADRPRRDKRQSPGSDSEAGAVGDTTSPRWNEGGEKRSQRIKKGVQVPSAGSEDVADAKGEPKRPRLRKDGTKPNQRVKPSDSGGNGWRWLPEPDVGRVAHGIPSRVDRLKCLGNAIVPQVVERIGRAILEAEGG